MRAPALRRDRRLRLLVGLAARTASHRPPAAAVDIGEQVVGLERARVCVLFLEQQPLRLLRRLAAAHQVPAALELVAEQLEAQVALGQLRFGVVRRGPDAVVEQRDMAAAVVALAGSRLRTSRRSTGWSSTSTAMRLTDGS